MTTPKRPVRTDEDVDATLRAWLAHGSRSLAEPAIQRVLTSVETTRQESAWRARIGPACGSLPIPDVKSRIAASAWSRSRLSIVAAAPGSARPPTCG